MLHFTQRALGKVLVVAELHNGKISPATLAAVTAGQSLGPVSTLVAGKTATQLASELAKVKGVAEVLVAKGDHYDNGLPEEYAPLITEVVKKNSFTHVLAGTSAFGKNIIPRAAALADSMPISEVTEVKDESTFVRLMYAGNVVSTVKSSDNVKYATIRGTCFERAAVTGGSAATVDIPATSVVGKSTFVEDVIEKSDKPDLQTATNIIAGGRGLKEAKNFKLLEDLAKPLKAAVGATRAVVDAGYCSNEMQIGQTGKTVAPNFYLGCGVSGAIQHVAGMKDSKVIAVINNDEDAPFFQVADYGLVEDLFVAVPKLTEMVKK